MYGLEMCKILAFNDDDDDDDNVGLVGYPSNTVKCVISQVYHG